MNDIIGREEEVSELPGAANAIQLDGSRRRFALDPNGVQVDALTSV